MHLNKTKFKRNPSLGFDVCNITKAGELHVHCKG